MSDKKWVKVKALKQPLKKSENCKKSIPAGETGEMEEITAKALEAKSLLVILKDDATPSKPKSNTGDNK